MADTLEILKRGVEMALSNQIYREIEMNIEEDHNLRAKIIQVIGRAAGEVLHEFEYPAHYKRLLARKDCPKYMKIMQKERVEAYYPFLSLPIGKDVYVTFTKGGFVEEDELIAYEREI